jgi:hypothetical protein
VRLAGTTLNRSSGSFTTNFFRPVADVMLEVQNEVWKPKVGTCQQ